MTPAQKLRLYREKYGIRLRKGLSQNFLADPAVLSRIAGALEIRRGECVVEVGAGAGFLTERLLDAGARVIAVEVDRAMAGLLEGELGGNPALEVVRADILALDLGEELARRGVTRCAVTGNLPYHVTTPVLFRLIEQRGLVSRMILMVQREVGIRMAAKPGGKEYGALSVGTAYACSCERLFEVGPGAFIPPPRVRSAVLRLIPRDPPLGPEREAALFRLVRAAFSQRRKMLVNAVAEVAGGREAAGRALARAGLNGSRRGETLSLEEYLALAGGISTGPRP